MKFPKGVEVVGSAIIENNKGEILLVRSPKWSNKWTMPGGHIEPDETISKALEREAEEETGLKLKPIKIIAFGELINSKDFHRPAHFIYFDLLCKAKTENVKIDNKEVKDFKWVKPENALKMDLAESYDKTIKDYIEYKK
ncbi:MAG: NUDIX domain-containing protein [Patescibacteria group bacterium]